MRLMFLAITLGTIPSSSDLNILCWSSDLDIIYSSAKRGIMCSDANLVLCIRPPTLYDQFVRDLGYDVHVLWTGYYVVDRQNGHCAFFIWPWYYMFALWRWDYVFVLGCHNYVFVLRYHNYVFVLRYHIFVFWPGTVCSSSALCT